MALEFHCTEVGVACKAVTTADSKDDLLATVGDHAQKVHGVALHETLVDDALTKVRTTYSVTCGRSRVPTTPPRVLDSIIG
jgi:predicted small metal-binding protein